MLKMIAAGKTDVGKIRKGNEDNLMVTPEQGFVVVADGMGGHEHGEVASQMVIDLLRRFYAPAEDDTSIYPPLRPVIQGPYELVALDMALRWVNDSIWEKAQDDDFKNMGSTVVALKLSDEGTGIAVGHLGDSRCYRLRDGIFTQLTLDHSMIQAYALATKVSLASLLAKGYPNNILLSACGMVAKAEPTVQIFDVQEDDVYLLCSDGVTNELDDDAIVNILMESFPDVAQAANKIVAAAVAVGGKDNTTAVVCVLQKP